jgi:hypothetical protein
MEMISKSFIIACLLIFIQHSFPAVALVKACHDHCVGCVTENKGKQVHRLHKDHPLQTFDLLSWARNYTRKKQLCSIVGCVSSKSLTIPLMNVKETTAK